MFKSVIAIVFAITLFACEGNKKNIQKLNLKDEAPIAMGKNINLKYTDSGKVVTNLLAPVLWDFSNFEFPYQEFPEGVTVYFWNDKQEKTTITSKYAIRYEGTNMVDLRDEVVLLTSDSLVLNAEQLYWDQKNQWVFTDQPYRIEFNDGSYNDGATFDSSEDFKTFISRKNQGVQIIDKKEITDEQ
ncbi:LPS export ABC transporter periplasmic protein LptC [Candidatus Marifrigoribacter sp. Uisw_064]|uniref:LPS export ABC transporter periplasmic protein LptC n=1 Tax=Candidatus Marifrigoribacter sp. Uisw_064 TaxID=3230970 RepID=UPI003D3AE459